MSFDINQIRNKQRIIITGNQGITEIMKMVRTVLDQIGKPYGFIDEDLIEINESAFVIYKDGTALKDGAAHFHMFEPHMMLLHQIVDRKPPEYGSFEQYRKEFEVLADNLPKAGSIIYNENDPVAKEIGKKEREDVRNIEYTLLPGQKTNTGFQLNHNGASFEVKTNDGNFLSHAAAARALLKRIGISDDQFYDVIKTL